MRLKRSEGELSKDAHDLQMLLGLSEIPFQAAGPQRPHSCWDIALESVKTRREMLDELPEERRERKIREAAVWGIDLDVNETISWTIQRPPRTSFFGVMDFEEWLEWEAAKIPADYRIRGFWGKDSQRVEEITADEAAKLWGVQRKTWSSYVARGQAPQPIRHVGRTPLWNRAEITAARPRQ